MSPDSYTNQELFIEVGNGHELYVHDWGNKQAKAVIFNIHGGPGSSSKDKHKGQYDPTRQRVIFFDQRGSGRSLPYGSLEHNTTQDLVADITKIADRLKIKTFILRGGSWGSCLSLAYGLQHPERVKAMVLDGIFTGSKTEIDWLDSGLFQTHYPDVWQAYLDRTPKAHHKNPTAYHSKMALTGKDEDSKKSAYAYDCLESAVIQLDDRFVPEPYEEYDPTGAKIEMHYLANGCFMPDRHILDNAHKLSMPIYLIQGRYDMVCPPTTAYQLHQKLPNGELIWTTSGHKSERESWNIIRTLLLELTK